MGITSANSAARQGISRKEADDYAYLSHQRAASAQQKGYFAEEIAPLTLKVRGRFVEVEHDEHVKADTTVEKLTALPAAFKEDGVVTAGNASGINDGAAAVVVTTRRRAEALGVAPLGRIVSWGVAGVDPDIMGIGPVPASRQALHLAGARSWRAASPPSRRPGSRPPGPRRPRIRRWLPPPRPSTRRPSARCR